MLLLLLIEILSGLQKTLRDKHYKAQQGKVERLEKLCRALQKERTELSEKLQTMQGKELEEEEGTGPPDPQSEEPHDSCSPELDAQVDADVNANVDAVSEPVETASGTEEPGIQPDGESSSTSPPFEQLDD